MKALLIAMAVTMISLNLGAQTFTLVPMDFCSQDQLNGMTARSGELAQAEISVIEQSKNVKCTFKKRRFSSNTRVYNCGNMKVIISFLEQSCKPSDVKIQKTVIKY